MRIFLATLTTILMAALLAPYAPGEESTSYCVVVHHDSPLKQLSRTDLGRIFLGKKTLWTTGERIQPVLPSLREPAIEEFMQDVLGRSLSQYRAYWKRRLFSGGGTPPRTFGTQEDILAFVKTNPNAIAVVVRTPETSRNSIEITE